jgi:hypothetical protein
MLPTRVVLDQLWNRRALLLLSDFLVLLLVGRRLETLPWQTATQKVEEDVAESFEIVTS